MFALTNEFGKVMVIAQGDEFEDMLDQLACYTVSGTIDECEADKIIKALHAAKPPSEGMLGTAISEELTLGDENELTVWFQHDYQNLPPLVEPKCPGSYERATQKCVTGCGRPAMMPESEYCTGCASEAMADTVASVLEQAEDQSAGEPWPLQNHQFVEPPNDLATLGVADIRAGLVNAGTPDDDEEILSVAFVRWLGRHAQYVIAYKDSHKMDSGFVVRALR